MLPEQWAPVAGYEGYYEVSSHGLVRSLDRTIHHSNGVTRKMTGRILKAAFSDQYHMVSLYKYGKCRRVGVHVLVCETFNGPSNGLWALHEDGNYVNNYFENLYWGTPRQNQLDRVRHGKHDGANKTQCFRGHSLEIVANLAPGEWKKGKRTCLSCSRTYSFVTNRTKRHGQVFSESEKIEMSNQYYKEILASERDEE